MCILFIVLLCTILVAGIARFKKKDTPKTRQGFPRFSVAGDQHDYRQNSKQPEPEIRNHRTNGWKQKMPHKQKTAGFRISTM